MEPVSPDTFLGGVVLELAPPAHRANVIALRPRNRHAPLRIVAPPPPPPPPAAA